MPYSPSEVFSFFREKLATHGDSSAALDWSEASQKIRFDICLSTIKLQPKDQVLDLGCGLGHLADYLPPEVLYLGLDGCADMLQAAQQRNNHTFRVADVLEDPLPKADLVVANGVLNLEVTHNVQDMAFLMDRAFTACRKACVITMLSDYAPNHKANRFYYDPKIILDLALASTPRVDLLHSYLPHDFCVRMYR